MNHLAVRVVLAAMFGTCSEQQTESNVRNMFQTVFLTTGILVVTSSFMAPACIAGGVRASMTFVTLFLFF